MRTRATHLLPPILHVYGYLKKFASGPEGATAIVVRLVIPLNQCGASPFMWALKDMSKSATSWRPKSKMNRLHLTTSQLWMKSRCPATFRQGDSLPGLLRGVKSDEYDSAQSAPHIDWDVALAQIRLNGPTVLDPCAYPGPLFGQPRILPASLCRDWPPAQVGLRQQRRPPGAAQSFFCRCCSGMRPMRPDALTNLHARKPVDS